MTAASGTSTLLLRADAGVSMGAGHVVRCLALAQGWRDIDGEACFVMAQGAKAFCKPLRAERIRIHTLEATPGGIDDARETIRLAREHSAAWVVVDGYHLGPSYRREIVGAGLRLAVLDDSGEQGQYVAEVIINVGMTLGLMPITGMTLPFVSYGGTTFTPPRKCMPIARRIRGSCSGPNIRCCGASSPRAAAGKGKSPLRRETSSSPSAGETRIT